MQQLIASIYMDQIIRNPISHILLMCLRLQLLMLVLLTMAKAK